MRLITYDGKSCDKEDCSGCEKCIFDVDNKEDNNMSLNEINVPKSCNVCRYSQCSLVSRGSIKNYNNWHCSYNGLKVLLDMSVPSDKDVNVPSFCPLKKVKNGFDTKPSNKFVKMTYSEMRTAFEKIKPLIEWNDIKEKTVYHVPPLPSEIRKDIYIISKNDYSCTYRILSHLPSSSSSTCLTMYKSSLMHKFLQEHRIKNIEVVSIGNTNK